MSLELASPLIESYRNSEGKVDVVCTDERGLKDGVYLAGGGYGLEMSVDCANDIAIARPQPRRERKKELLHARTGLLAIEAFNNDVVLHIHPGCAAQLGARAIGRTIHHLDLRDLEEGIEQLTGEIQPVKFVRRAKEWYGDSGNYDAEMDPETVYKLMSESGVPNHAVRPDGHCAKRVVVEREGRHSNADAWDAGNPGYGYSPEGIVYVADQLEASHPAATDTTVRVASATFQFGTMYHLPNGGDNSQKGILLGRMPLAVEYS